MRRAGYLLPAIIGVCFVLGAIAGILAGPLTTRAVQNPRMSLDMDPAGNGYDPASNTMTVGSIDHCLADAVGNPSTHSHTVHIVVEDVEDLIGWQARLNYRGDEMRPIGVNLAPFIDTTTQQEISFVNLPKDSGTNAHREITRSAVIPPLKAAWRPPRSAPCTSGHRPKMFRQIPRQRTRPMIHPIVRRTVECWPQWTSRCKATRPGERCSCNLTTATQMYRAVVCRCSRGPLAKPYICPRVVSAAASTRRAPRRARRCQCRRMGQGCHSPIYE
jgi:hypothetical protein